MGRTAMKASTCSSVTAARAAWCRATSSCSTCARPTGELINSGSPAAVTRGGKGRVLCFSHGARGHISKSLSTVMRMGVTL